MNEFERLMISDATLISLMFFRAEANDDMFLDIIFILIQKVYADTLCAITSNTENEDEMQSVFQLCNRILDEKTK
jgi:hypothetical protein